MPLKFFLWLDKHSETCRFIYLHYRTTVRTNTLFFLKTFHNKGQKEEHPSRKHQENNPRPRHPPYLISRIHLPLKMTLGTTVPIPFKSCLVLIVPVGKVPLFFTQVMFSNWLPRRSVLSVIVRQWGDAQVIVVRFCIQGWTWRLRSLRLDWQWGWFFVLG